MNKLIRQLKIYDDAYYNKGNSISDDIYDSLKDEVRKLYPNDPYFKTIGATVTSDKVKLPYVLNSLTKLTTDNFNTEFKYGDDRYIVTPKYDGCSIYVEYNNGQVTFAATRGDGYVGRNITDKAKIFCPRINMLNRLIVRGEVLLRNDVSTLLNFKNSRNGVSGIINRDSLKDCDQLLVIFYELIKLCDDDGSDITGITEEDRLRCLTDIFKSNACKYWTFKDINSELLTDRLNTIKLDDELNYDGLVITYDNSRRENVYYPTKKLAFKLANSEVATTRVVNIEWHVGRTGRLVPVAIFEPVKLNGAIINRATAFNFKFVVDNVLRVGSTITIKRSGEVIPYIINVINDDGLTDICLTMTKDGYSCPSCGTILDQHGVDLVCTNVTCNKIKKITYFLRKLGVTEIDEKTIEKLDINDVIDLYGLNMFLLTTIPGIGLNKATMIVDEIEKTLKTTMVKLLSAFGIPQISDSVSKLIVTNIIKDGPFDILFDHTKYTIDDLIAIKGIGDSIAESFYVHILKYKKLYDDLVNFGLEFTTDEANDKMYLDDVLNGKIITLTGTCYINNIGKLDRDELTRLIELHGGVVKGISTKTYLLVTDDLNSSSAKTVKAKKLGINLMSYTDFYDTYLESR